MWHLSCLPFLDFGSQLMHWFLPHGEAAHFPSTEFRGSLYPKHWLSLTLHAVAKHQVWDLQDKEENHLT